MYGEGRLDGIPSGLRRLFAAGCERGSVLAPGHVPLVAATALVALVLVMAVATAGFAVLMGVLVVMAVAAARGLAGLCERAGNECLDAGVAAALGACIDRDAGLGKCVDGAPANAP